MKFNGNVLVTGGAGFIGKEVVKKLQFEGYNVTVIDLKPQPDDLQFVRYIQGDIIDISQCLSACENQDYIIHLAAKARIPESFTNPSAYFLNNVVGTQNLLAAAAAKSIKKVVYASSSSVYGNHPTPNKPYHKPNPLNYYAMTKLFGEHLCKQFRNLYGLEYTILRLFTVYGDGQPSDDMNGLMIAKFARLAAENLPLTIHGDGNFRRDFIHVYDVANAFYTAIESKVKNEVFNVGTEQNISINEVVEILRQYKPELNISYIPKPKGYASSTLSDTSKTRKLLGWKHKVSPHDGIHLLYFSIFSNNVVDT
jgi:nucleoside-diphosphate-sugar epimerase